MIGFIFNFLSLLYFTSLNMVLHYVQDNTQTGKSLHLILEEVHLRPFFFENKINNEYSLQKYQNLVYIYKERIPD